MQASGGCLSVIMSFFGFLGMIGVVVMALIG